MDQVAGAPDLVDVGGRRAGARRRPRAVNFRGRRRAAAPPVVEGAEQPPEEAVQGEPRDWRRLLVVLAALLLAPTLLYAALLANEAGPRVGEEAQVQHVVQRGETLSAIAARNGLSLEALLGLGGNRTRFPNPNSIHPGQRVDLR